ncbi:MAG: aldehyde dehydrogenase family protein [Flavobacteriales bacterium]|nr:aldehyde dehydrogenase family protein [Flavobacteriales bacterium]
MVSESQLNGNLEYVALASSEGAHVIGGERLDGPAAGYYQRPAVFLGATNQMRTSHEEIFGPCVSVIMVGDFDEALSVANDTEFGLSSGICTSNLKYAREFKKTQRGGLGDRLIIV